MLKHRHSLVIFLSLAVLLLLLKADILFFVILAVLFFSFQFYGAAYINSGVHLKAFCQAQTSEKIVALTFDDGPGAHTASVLDLLKQEGLKATFFLIGRKIAGNEQLLKRMHDEGHILGNHSYAHNFWFDLKMKNQFKEDLTKAGLEIQRVIGSLPVYFRPPYGVSTPALAVATREGSLLNIGWNIRSFDTRGSAITKTAERITNRLQPGSIILLHDTQEGAEDLLKILLKELKQRDYRVVGLDELCKTKPYV